MCGIIGVAAAPGQQAPGLEVGRAMNALIRHRGPDDDGFFADGRVLLGMRRLAVIDLAGGHQPMHNADGSVQAVFNGEIYNYRELRAELVARGHAFYSESDSEVVVQAWEAWGEGCFARLEGMFAIALWDARRQLLVLARDRFGEKPLFWHDDGRRLAFASELKSLLALPGFRRELDADAVRAYACFGYVPAPRSIFVGVAKLEPGHYLAYAGGKARISRYYTLPFTPKFAGSEAEAGDELARRLDAAVASRLVADVPFGAFLSGGLDSSVVVALMARHLGQPVRTFSIGFREDAFNELSDARRVARHLGTEHHELVAEPDAVDLLQQLVWYLDEPFADSSAIPTFLVSRLARQHVTMVLTGDGGDEAFGGYDRYLRFLALQRLGAARPLAGLAAAAAGRLVPGSTGYRLRGLGERLRQPFPDSYLSGVAMTRADLAAELLGEAGGNHYGAAPRRTDGGAEMLDRIVALDIDGYLADDILVKLDRMAMANSLEGRAPLLDHRVVEFAVQLPPSLRIRHGRGKHLLREVARRWLPAEVLDKPKQGFAIPLDAWFRGPLRALAEDVLASRAFRERGLVRPEAARRILDAHLAGQAAHGETLWLVLSLELWARRFLDAPAGEGA